MKVGKNVFQQVFFCAGGGTSISCRGGKCSAIFGAALLDKHTFSVVAPHPFKPHVFIKKALAFTSAFGAEGGT